MSEIVKCCKEGCDLRVVWVYHCMLSPHTYYCDAHANELDYFLESAIEYHWERYRPEKRTTGFCADGVDVLERSARQIAENLFKRRKINCRITELSYDGKDDGHLCFRVCVEMDVENAKLWDSLYL